VQTRRDQLHAYRFLTKRALASLVTGEPNAVEPPMRRLTIMTVSGVMIAVLVAAGFAVFGLIRPSTGSSWKESGAVIVEKQTGATYVYVDGVLHPALNYVSAVLALSTGSQGAHVVEVDQSDLAKTPRGATFGILGLPPSVPSADKLSHYPWTVCSRQANVSADQTGALQASASVHIGQGVPATALPGNQAVVVRAIEPPARSYVVLGGKRHFVRNPRVLPALNLNLPALAVSTAFLNALPPGSDLDVPVVPGEGQPGPVIGGKPTIIGQLAQTADGHAFIVVARGLAQVNAVEKAVLESATLPPVTLDPSAAITAATNVPALNAFPDLPSSVPVAATTPAQVGGLCAVYSRASAPPVLTTPPTLLPPGTAGSGSNVQESAASRSGQADEVDLPPGGAALVQTSANVGDVYLVAEPGQSFATNQPDVLKALGYGDVTPDVVPPQLLAPLIPAGPALNPAAAGIVAR
jgi:type VII secretion protein EccB